jgi:pimeloyl-ACP methyl ester carboxylesterase
MSVTNTTIKTSHADIAVAETAGEGLPVVLLHGNSACKEVFSRQLESELGDRYRMVAVDLPGHGASSDAFDPQRSYTMPGYAEAMVEVLAMMGIDRAVVYGWSLGGHVGMEMLTRYPGMVGLMISGAPPVGQSMEEIQAGFRPLPGAVLAGQPDLSEEEIEIFALGNYGPPVEPMMREAIARTDGRAREMMIAGFFTGQASNQRDLAVNSVVPLAVVNGADDPLVNIEYVGSLPYTNLWDKHCFVLRGAGHAPFLRVPEAFNNVMGRFLDDMAKRAKSRGGKSSDTVAA